MNNVELGKVFLKSLEEEFKFKKMPSLSNINFYLDYFKRPELSFEKRVIVSGTAGKGTTCKAIETILLNNDVSTCCLYSPHIQVVFERVRINGEIISKESFYDVLVEIKKVKDKTCGDLSYYECLVLLGILAGKKSNCDVLICEVGLGGDFDATNAIEGERISAITFIGMDHMHILGNKLEDIALKKLGIVTSNTIKAFSYEKNLKNFLMEHSCKEIVFFEFEDKYNERLGVKICEHILDVNNIEIPEVSLPCRFEKVNDNFILDGAHSKPRFLDIVPKIKKIPGEKIAVVGILQNHELDGLNEVLELFDKIIWTKIDFIRPYYDPNELKKIFGFGEIFYDYIDIVKEYENKKGLTVVVLGSFYLAGKFRDYFIPVVD